MKTLQNNFTTPEQSKRLLELGVPADSADMRYENDLVGGQYNHVSYSSPDYGVPRKYFEDDVPCWSVGRLMEIFDLCYPEENETVGKDWVSFCRVEKAYSAKSYIEYVINCFVCNVHELDFSKLEE